MRKTLFVLPVTLLTLCAIGLTSCTDLDFNEGIGVVEVALPHKATYSFASFKGTKKFKMSCDQDAGMKLEYSCKIEKGIITISYKVGDEKNELCALLEASEKCNNGSFRFEINK